MRIKNYDKGRKKEAQAQHNRISSKWGYACHLTLTPLFLPNFGDLFLVDLGRKHPGPTKIHPLSPLNKKTKKTLFSPTFSIPPNKHPNQMQCKRCAKKNWSITKCHPYPTNLALTYTSFNLYGLKYTFSCSTLTCQKFSFDKQNKVISRSFNMTKHTTSDKSQ